MVKPTLGTTIAVGDIVDRYKGAQDQIAVALESAVPVLPDGTATQNRNVNRQFRRSQQRSMEEFIDQVADELDADTLAWIRRQLPTTYADGMAKIALATDSVLPVEWNLLHRQAVTVLIADTAADLAAATAHMTDAAKAFLRAAAKREVLDQVATGRAAAIGRNLAKRLQSEGLSAFVDSQGRSWKLATYAEMVVRTKRQAAFNAGATLRMHQQGVSACTIIDGTRFDSDCTAINGKTCSVPWSLDHPLEHPQCTRTFAPLVPPPEALDYGSYDDTLPLSQLGQVAPDSQALYAPPPTLNPAANPVQAAKEQQKAADEVKPPSQFQLGIKAVQWLNAKGFDVNVLGLLKTVKAAGGDTGVEGLLKALAGGQGDEAFSLWMADKLGLPKKASAAKVGKVSKLADELADVDATSQAALASKLAAQQAEVLDTATTAARTSVLFGPDEQRPRRRSAPDDVERHAQDWDKVLAYVEREAVSSYTGSAYLGINSQLRAGSLDTSTSITVGRIDAALAKAGPLPNPTPVWRGVRFRDQPSGTWEQRADWTAQQFPVGSTVTWDAYSSTSISPTVAADSFGGGGVVFEIEAVEGVYVKPVSRHSTEDELLLPRGARFEVTDVIRSAPFEGGGYRTVVQMRQLPSGDG